MPFVIEGFCSFHLLRATLVQLVAPLRGPGVCAGPGQDHATEPRTIAEALHGNTLIGGLVRG